MADKDVKIDIDQLDDDLKELLEICESEKLQSVKAAITNLSLSEEQFTEIVSADLVRLCFSLLIEERYKSLSESLPEDVVARVKEAKSLVEKHFPDILKHPVIKSLVEKAKLEEELSETLIRDKLNTIYSVTWLSTWMNLGEKLTPAVRIGFKNRGGKILLDSTADWEDLGDLARMVIGIFAGLLKETKPLVVADQIDLSDSDDIATHIKWIQRYLDEIRKLAPDCGINLEGKIEKQKET